MRNVERDVAVAFLEARNDMPAVDFAVVVAAEDVDDRTRDVDVLGYVADFLFAVRRFFSAEVELFDDAMDDHVRVAPDGGGEMRVVLERESGVEAGGVVVVRALFLSLMEAED